MEPKFESFAELVYRLGHPPKSKKFDASGNALPVAPDKIFLSWINHHRPFAPGTGKRLFRLLFPHDGSRRRYGLKETKLANELERILHVRGLREWDIVSWEGRSGLGCLGDVLQSAMTQRLPAGTSSSLTLTEIDTLLDQLAAPSPFSQLSLQPLNPPPASIILRQLYRDSGLSPVGMSVLTQVILRDLRPLLCPLPVMPVRHPAVMLRVKTTEAPQQLGLHTAMWCWDEVMARLYRDGKGSVDWFADAAEAVAAATGSVVPVEPGPVLGINVQVPKCIKGRSVQQALSGFFDSTGPKCHAVWAETKYDGYRMQIHVRLLHGKPDIIVFSKSKRRSTVERRNTHASLFATLGLPIPPGCPVHPDLARRVETLSTPGRRVTSSVILEAEVVPFNDGNREGDRGPGIEEFWWLGDAGVTADAEHCTGTIGRPRHLCLVFFDILHLNGQSLIDMEYDTRRELLESIVAPIYGFTCLAERVKIPLDRGLPGACVLLESEFSRACKAREEGLVLKGSSSTYNDTNLRWVKLKDYIPNLGDCIDLVLLGAGWDVDRARDLRVDTSVYTTFYIGVLTNRESVQARRDVPHFEILFRSSYGASRDQLEIYNENLRLGRWPTKPYDKNDPWKRRLISLSWRYYMPKSMPPPSVLLEQPLCVEVMGAGFQKLPLSRYYEIRWPRLMKIFDKAERPWPKALSGAELVTAAHQSLGYAPSVTPLSPENDSLRALWRSRSTAVVDIPDLSPTPRKHPPPTPTRRASAPCILKLSPPTPQCARLVQPLPVTPTPCRLRFLPPSGQRLADAMAELPTPVISSGIQLRARNVLSPVKRRRLTLSTYMAAAQASSSPSHPSKPLSLRSRLSLARETCQL